MAGRGKMSFNTEQLGFGRGEALPPPNLQPPPAYPTLGLFPSPLLKSSENVYMGARLGEQRRKFQASPFYVLADSPKPDIERYSDKFQAPKAKEFKYDTSYLPAELRPATKRKKKTPKIPYGRTAKPDVGMAKKVVGPDIDQRLKVLEESEAKSESGEEEEEDQRKDEQLDEEVEDEEELEEETDYVSAYFDNGEGYLDDDDDKVDDGPIY